MTKISNYLPPYKNVSSRPTVRPTVLSCLTSSHRSSSTESVVMGQDSVTVLSDVSFFVACSTVLATILDSLLISVVLYVADECILI